MSFNFAHNDQPVSSDAGEGYGLRATWGETVVTAVATSLAVMIVATVAILMGMA